MEKLKSETDALDSENQTVMEFESGQFKKEFPDVKDFVKSETNETVNDKSNEFVTDNQNLSHRDDELLIKKENRIDSQFKYDSNTSKSSCHNENPGSIFKSETVENSVVMNTNMFSVHPQDFDKNKGECSSSITCIEPFKFYRETFPETFNQKSQSFKKTY